MSKILNATDELLLELRDQNKISQTDVRDLNKELRDRMKRHLKEKKEEREKSDSWNNNPEYNYHGVGK